MADKMIGKTLVAIWKKYHYILWHRILYDLKKLDTMISSFGIGIAHAESNLLKSIADTDIADTY